MRLGLALALALALVGCSATGATTSHVRVRNGTDGPAMIIVVITDTSTRTTEFEHGFQVVQPDQALEVAHVFARGGTYVVNATAWWGSPPIEATAERRVDVPEGADVEVHLSATGLLDIVVLVTE